MSKMDDDAVVEDKIIKMPDLNYVPSPYGMGYEFFCCMKKNRRLVAQVDSQTQKKDTYGQLLRRCIRTAIELKARGVTSTDTICLCSYNQLNSCVPYLASLFIGAKVCSLDPSMSFDDSKYLLSLVSPRFIFVVAEKEQMYEELVQDMDGKCELIIFDGGDGSNSFETFLRERPDENDFEPEKVEDINDTAVIIFSSGTTGLCKGICLSHYAVLVQGKAIGYFGFDCYRILSFASLYWISAIVFLTSSILEGTARIMCKSYNPHSIWYDIGKLRVTAMMMAPVQAIIMLKEGRPEGVDTTSLLDLIIGGGSISSVNLLSLRDLLPGTNIFQLYGQTELAGPMTTFRTCLRKDLFLLHHKPNSCGRPLFGMWYKIVDIETEEVLSYNQSGELRIKTKFNPNGYYNQDSSDMWDEEGWIKTGDVAYYDEDLCFYIVDRIKEMLKYRSWHVAPALLEHILHEHYAVKSAVVIGVPHDEDGEHALGVVILSENADNVTAEMLVEYVNGKVDERKKLRAGVVFVENLPYTPSGKVKRKLLREMILANMRKE